MAITAPDRIRLSLTFIHQPPHGRIANLDRAPTLVTPQRLAPHCRDTVLFAPDLHPVVAQDEVLARGRLHDRERGVQSAPARIREVHALDVVMEADINCVFPEISLSPPVLLPAIPQSPSAPSGPPFTFRPPYTDKVCDPPTSLSYTIFTNDHILISL